VQIAVHYLAQVKQAAGTASEQVEVAGPCAVQDFVARLAERHGPPLQHLLLGADGQLQPTILLFVGDDQVGPDDPVELKDKDVVTLLSPVAGG
jgi:molybdopterin converting factor small subunit